MRGTFIAFMFAASSASAICPDVTVRVDNDIAGSGYSEEPARNWTSHDVDACSGTYRYLSHDAGDGTRRGKAIWAPTIPRAGVYEVVVGFRASANRAHDADYFLYDNDGHQAVHKDVDQHADPGGCAHETLGRVFCAPGGACRVVLDGNDGESAAADITTFTLVSCDDAPPTTSSSSSTPPSACASIAADDGMELCSSTADQCAGVFKQGQGCNAFCGAAGMVCVARYGGDVGCHKEATAMPCDVENGHATDWCECGLPVGGISSSSSSGGPASSSSSTEPEPQGVTSSSSSSSSSASSSTGEAGASSSSSSAMSSSTGEAAEASSSSAEPEVETAPAQGGCSSTSTTRSVPWISLLLFSAALLNRRRR